MGGRVGFSVGVVYDQTRVSSGVSDGVNSDGVCVVSEELLKVNGEEGTSSRTYSNEPHQL